MFSGVSQICCKILLKSIHLHDFLFLYNALEFSSDNYEIGKEGLSHEGYKDETRRIRLQKNLYMDFKY